MIPVRENGALRRISIREAIQARFIESALKGDIKSAAFVLNRSHALEEGAPPMDQLNDDDRATLEAFEKIILAKSKKGG
jgi:hypothetical protein